MSRKDESVKLNSVVSSAGASSPRAEGGLERETVAHLFEQRLLLVARALHRRNSHRRLRRGVGLERPERLCVLRGDGILGLHADQHGQGVRLGVDHHRADVDEHVPLDRLERP